MGGSRSYLSQETDDFKVFRDFLQFLEANAETVPTFFTHSYQLNNHNKIDTSQSYIISVVGINFVEYTKNEPID
jgi:hypothetical protein